MEVFQHINFGKQVISVNILIARLSIYSILFTHINAELMLWQTLAGFWKQ